jgi:hypothetical protein
MIVISGRGVPALTDHIDYSTRICADPDQCLRADQNPPTLVSRGRVGQLADTPLLVASSRALLQPGSG